MRLGFTQITQFECIFLFLLSLSGEKSVQDEKVRIIKGDEIKFTQVELF